MTKWDEEQSEDDNDVEVELPAEIEYPPLNYNGEIYWNEMSYHRLTQTSLCWNYDTYSNGTWQYGEVNSATNKTTGILCTEIRNKKIEGEKV